MFNSDVLFAFSLTLLAGLATGIGSLIALFANRTNTKMLTISLGFSAGVMVYVSFVEILSKARDSLAETLSDDIASWVTVASFFSGIAIIGIIDRFVPESTNPHEVKRIEELNDSVRASKDRLMRMGLISALAIGIHNFPEGLATFMSALKDPTVGIPIAVAIAIHNIPEGIAVSIPVFYATGSKTLAFRYSFLSGISEPLGAIIGYTILYFLFNDLIFGVLFGMVAGIMVYISFDELLPMAEEYGEHHLAIYGLITGMAVMALSLLLFL